MVAKTVPAPTARVGDWIIVESERVGQPPREGEILSISRSPTPTLGPNYEVRWTDGHVSSFRPAAGSARIVRGRPTPTR
jgi:hypothetical protein